MAKSAPNRNLDGRQEAGSLKAMWNRHSHNFLATYLKGGKLHPFYNPQQFFVRDIILNCLQRKNPGVNVLLERRMMSPLFWLYGRCHGLVISRASFLSDWFQDLMTFAGERSRERLRYANIKNISLLDVGCGSANFYDGFQKTGLTYFMEYTGIDIAEKNIENCKILYPDANFRLGDARNIEFSNNSFDVVLASRILEYLSLDDLEIALSEIMRVARDTVILNFFYEKDMPEHIVNKVALYHRNGLSRLQLRALLQKYENVSIRIVDTYAPLRNKKIEYTDPAGNPVSYSTWVVEKA